jgi:hypothetical protein
MARVNKAAAKPKKKTVRAVRRGANMLPLMPTKKLTWHKAHYYTHYEVESKEWLTRCKGYIKNKYDKSIVTAINKLPDWKVGGKSHWACAAYLLENDMADLVPDGHVKGLDKWILELAEEGSALVEEKKAEDKTKKNVYVPTIQERIRDQSQDMIEDIDEWLEGWIADPETFDPKSFDFKKHFNKLQPSQAHARKMKTFYSDVLEDFDELERMPTAGQLKKMDEHTQDQWAQLKEGYAHLKKGDIKKFRTAIDELMAALDFIIDSAKANRKPRKAKPKSATKVVEKLKYAKTDEKYKLASIDPSIIVGANELWVFNTKTRKLGKYVAQNIDPKGMGRDGTGLSVKGTTIIGFNEKESIQKTLRKPDEQLKAFKGAGKVALRKFMDEIATTDTKLNGRCNPDTVLLKVN